jgi:TonB family protein
VEAVPLPTGETPQSQVEPRPAGVTKPVKVDSLKKEQGGASGVPGGVEIGAGRDPAASPGELPMVSWEEATAHLISPVQPAYPRGALAERRSGAVMLQIEISPEGTVTDARILVGADDFAESAMAAVMQSRFRPFLVQGRPVAVRTQARYVFRLQ